MEVCVRSHIQAVEKHDSWIEANSCEEPAIHASYSQNGRFRWKNAPITRKAVFHKQVSSILIAAEESGMAESRNLEYCVLRYAPNVISKEGVLIAAIFIYPSDPDREECAITFAPYWQEKIRLFDPDSDLEMIAATLDEIRDRLQSPTNRDTLHQLEDSFSNTIQISD